MMVGVMKSPFPPISLRPPKTDHCFVDDFIKKDSDIVVLNFILTSPIYESESVPDPNLKFLV